MHARRPRLLDLFCGAGGASAGYASAGFDVTGADIKPQRHYPFEFILGDALMLALADFDAFHASPPCQRFTRFRFSQPQRDNYHPDLIGKIRRRLEATGRPFVIENVAGAPLRSPVRVCGTSFGLGVERGLLWRHRYFESNCALNGTACKHDGRPAVMVAGHGKDGYRGSGLAAAEASAAMRIDWMNRDELAEAIPPIYAEYIGLQLIAYASLR